MGFGLWDMIGRGCRGGYVCGGALLDVGACGSVYLRGKASVVSFELWSQTCFVLSSSF
jgi:hypothetical protein